MKSAWTRVAIPFLLCATLAASGAVQPGRPRLSGVAHMAIYVSDIEKARGFYRDLLGFQEPYDLKNSDGSLSMTFFKVNEDQYIEVFPGLKPDQDRLNHIALATDDAAALRTYLAARGVRVPAAVSKVRIGNTSFNVTDPEGHTVEFTQYEPDGWTRRETGKFLGDNRISTHILHLGILVGDALQTTAFYGDALGLKEFWRGNSANAQFVSWINMRLPDSQDYLEYMLYSELPPPPARHPASHLPGSAGHREGAGAAGSQSLPPGLHAAAGDTHRHQSAPATEPVRPGRHARRADGIAHRRWNAAARLDAAAATKALSRRGARGAARRYDPDLM